MELILAMQEPHMERLLSGEKKAEVRRTRPSTVKLDGASYMRLYLYKGGCIHGYVEVDGWWRFRDEIHPVGANVQPMIEMCAEMACLTPDEMREYLKGNPVGAIVYRVSPHHVPVRYTNPVPVPCRPQSWQYLSPAVASLLPL